MNNGSYQQTLETGNGCPSVRLCIARRTLLVKNGNSWFWNDCCTWGEPAGGETSYRPIIMTIQASASVMIVGREGIRYLIELVGFMRFGNWLMEEVKEKRSERWLISGSAQHPMRYSNQRPRELTGSAHSFFRFPPSWLYFLSTLVSELFSDKIITYLLAPFLLCPSTKKYDWSLFLGFWHFFSLSSFLTSSISSGIFLSDWAVMYITSTTKMHSCGTVQRTPSTLQVHMLLFINAAHGYQLVLR